MSLSLNYAKETQKNEINTTTTTTQAALWQMNVSAKIGVPEHLCNTYDILGPTKSVSPSRQLNADVN